jgi:hypothetical protein
VPRNGRYFCLSCRKALASISWRDQDRVPLFTSILEEVFSETRHSPGPILGLVQGFGHHHIVRLLADPIAVGHNARGAKLGQE